MKYSDIWNPLALEWVANGPLLYLIVYVYDPLGKYRKAKVILSEVLRWRKHKVWKFLLEPLMLCKAVQGYLAKLVSYLSYRRMFYKSIKRFRATLGTLSSITLFPEHFFFPCLLHLSYMKMTYEGLNRFQF